MYHSNTLGIKFCNVLTSQLEGALHTPLAVRLGQWIKIPSKTSFIRKDSISTSKIFDFDQFLFFLLQKFQTEQDLTPSPAKTKKSPCPRKYNVYPSNMTNKVWVLLKCFRLNKQYSQVHNIDKVYTVKSLLPPPSTLFIQTIRSVYHVAFFFFLQFCILETIVYQYIKTLILFGGSIVSHCVAMSSFIFIFLLVAVQFFPTFVISNKAAVTRKAKVAFLKDLQGHRLFLITFLKNNHFVPQGCPYMFLKSPLLKFLPVFPFGYPLMF